jgi:hypothetical protein
MNHSQYGFSLTEIAIACGVLATMVIGGLSFYNNQIAKAQASEAMIVGKMLTDQLQDKFSEHSALEDIVIPAFTEAQYIEVATWTGVPAATYTTTNAWGYIDVMFNSINIQGSLAGKHTYFLFETSDNKSFLKYKGCAIDSQSGAMSTLVAGDPSPVLPCEYQSGVPTSYYGDFDIV